MRRELLPKLRRQCMCQNMPDMECAAFHLCLCTECQGRAAQLVSCGDAAIPELLSMADNGARVSDGRNQQLTEETGRMALPPGLSARVPEKVTFLV